MFKKISLYILYIYMHFWEDPTSKNEKKLHIEKTEQKIVLEQSKNVVG